MPWVIGTDEAGYGPNLGPLVIGASVWHYSGSLPLDRALSELAAALGTIEDPPRAKGIAIADSKRLYSPQRGLALLESCLLAALSACDQMPSSWRDVWAQLAPTSASHFAADLTYSQYHSAWPTSVTHDLINSLASGLREILSLHHWRLHSVHCRAIFPAEFNAAVRRLGNKAHVLSQNTLELAAEALQELPSEDALVCCDKHGGRNRYASVLQHCFPDGWITTGAERSDSSTYDCRLADRVVRFEFRAGGECQAPTALGSMAAKYLRELAMHAFNAFWAGHVADLAPTAGYPNDAKRFESQVRAAREKLGIGVDAFWREK
jgi:hypothetical protein